MDTSDEIRKRYASEAKTYREDALIINFDAPRLFESYLDILKKYYKDQDRKLRVLDLGAGNGMLTELVFSLYKNASYTMFDFSSGMLESSKYIFEENKMNIDVKRVVGNFITDEFPDSEYDLIISSYALHHIRTVEELRSVYEKINNHLSKQGLFLCLDNYLGKNIEERKEQLKISLKKWEESYNSREKALEWGSILEGEDSPATIKTIISLLSMMPSSTPLLYNLPGVMANIYGLSKLDEDELKKLDLDYLVKSWKDRNICTPDENEYLISNYKYSEE